MGVKLAPLTMRERIVAAGVTAAVGAVSAAVAWDSLCAFLRFGCVAIGGGFPLVPFYFHTFVEPDAALLKMSAEDFSNLMALTQMTPGPVSLNAATYFGYGLNGVVGSLVASAALLAPSYLMLTTVLSGLDRWRGNPAMRFFLAVLKPVFVTLMAIALWKFCSLSVWEFSAEGEIVFNPLAALLAIGSAVLFVKRKLSAMALVFLCAILGCLQACFAG
jgi:chromate transporter